MVVALTLKFRGRFILQLNQGLWSALRFHSSQKSLSDLEDKLKRWGQAPSASEQEKSERAVRMVKNAIDADPKLSKMNLTVFAKGSYANRTNIPSDSDVDVGVTLNTLFYNTYPDGMDLSDFGFVKASYGYEDFKKDIATAILKYFGKDDVTLGNKAITVHSNTCRVDADVVPHAIHRRYKADKSYIEGVALKTSSGIVIYNWPAQDYDNAVAKNERTSKRYKAFTRILKNLRGDMAGNRIEIAQDTASYLLACLAWNVPNSLYNEESYLEMTENCLAYLIGQTANFENVKLWVEVNELKYLFGSHQGWKFEDVRAFLIEAYHHLQGMKK